MPTSRGSSTGVPAERRCKSVNTRRYALYAQGASACPQAKLSEKNLWLSCGRGSVHGGHDCGVEPGVVQFYRTKFGQSSVVRRVAPLFATARYTIKLQLRTSNMPLRTKSCKNTSSP